MFAIYEKTLNPCNNFKNKYIGVHSMGSTFGRYMLLKLNHKCLLLCCCAIVAVRVKHSSEVVCPN